MKMMTLLFLCFLIGPASGKILNVTRAVGESVDFRCLRGAEANSEKFLCLGDDKKCTGEVKKERYSLSQGENGDYTFLIKNLGTSDAGTYWCGFRSHFRSIHAAIRLAVSVPNSPRGAILKTAPTTEQRKELNDESTGGTMTAVCISVGVVATISVMLILLILYTQRKMKDMKSQDQGYVNTIDVSNVTARPTYQEKIYETLQADSLKHNVYQTLYSNTAVVTNISATPRDQTDIYESLRVETLQHDIYETLQII